MNCNEAEKLIPDFLKDNLDNQETIAFLEHVNQCASCREELTIQFLVSTGLKRLEDDGDFNLQEELNGKLREAGRQVRIRTGLQRVAVFLQFVVAAGAAAVIALIVLLQ